MHPSPSSSPPSDAEALELQLAQRQRLETLGVLAGGIAHDFNNLLTGILGHCDVLEDQLDAGHPAREEVDTIRQAAQRAARLSRRLLSFSRGDQGRHCVDLVGLVQETVPLLRSSAPRSIDWRVRLDLPSARVRADGSQLQQVIFNLGINAIHAIGRHEGLIEIGLTRLPAAAAPRLAVGTIDRGPHLCITFSDTGVGMEPETVARAFDPFYSTKPRDSGTGLGLTIVRTIVLQAGGGIALDSTPGEGTVFRILLPEAAAGTDAGDAGEAPGCGRIAIIDDEETVVRLAQQALDFSGYRTTTMATPEECIALLEREPNAVDLILTDQRMPSMSGIEMVQLLRARGVRTPVLITSGSIAAVSAGELRDAAPAAFLAKPFTLVDLLRSIEELVPPPGARAR